MNVIYALTGQRRVLKFKPTQHLHSAYLYLHAYLLPLPLCFSSWMQLSLYRLSSMSLVCLALFIMAQQGVLMIPCRLAMSVSPSLLLTQVPGHGRYPSNFFSTPQDVMLHLHISMQSYWNVIKSHPYSSERKITVTANSKCSWSFFFHLVWYINQIKFHQFQVGNISTRNMMYNL